MESRHPLASHQPRGLAAASPEDEVNNDGSIPPCSNQAANKPNLEALVQF